MLRVKIAGRRGKCQERAASPLKMVALDWAHTRLFAVYDGSDPILAPFPEALKRAKEAGKAAIERGAPLSFLYPLARAVSTILINGAEVAALREQRDLPKIKKSPEDDLVDATLIYELAQQDGRTPVALDDRSIRLATLFHQYLFCLRGQMKNRQLRQAVRRHFGDQDINLLWQLERHEEDLGKMGESYRTQIEALAPEPPPSIARLKGMSKWLWAGIVITADPQLFHTKQAYRKYCGLVDRKAIDYKFSRNASRAYWLCADQFIKQRTPEWRDVYDQTKELLRGREGYTHPHGGAMNRLMTAFANFVFETVRKEGVATQGVFSDL